MVLAAVHAQRSVVIHQTSPISISISISISMSISIIISRGGLVNVCCLTLCRGLILPWPVTVTAHIESQFTA